MIVCSPTRRGVAVCLALGILGPFAHADETQPAAVVVSVIGEWTLDQAGRTVVGAGQSLRPGERIYPPKLGSGEISIALVGGSPRALVRRCRKDAVCQPVTVTSPPHRSHTLFDELLELFEHDPRPYRMVQLAAHDIVAHEAKALALQSAVVALEPGRAVAAPPLTAKLDEAASGTFLLRRLDESRKLGPLDPNARISVSGLGASERVSVTDGVAPGLYAITEKSSEIRAGAGAQQGTWVLILRPADATSLAEAARAAYGSLTLSDDDSHTIRDTLLRVWLSREAHARGF